MAFLWLSSLSLHELPNVLTRAPLAVETKLKGLLFMTVVGNFEEQKQCL